MIIKIAGGKDNNGNVLWKHVYSDAIRNRLRRDQNLADIPDINEARKNLGIEHVSDSVIESLVSNLESYVLTKVNELRVELNSYRINHTDVDITALDSRLTALANKVTSLTMSDVDERFNTLWDAAKREIQNYILQLFGESDGILPDFPSDFSTLHWCGTMSDFPTQPKAGWFVIINNSTTDNLAYIYTGSSWVLISCNCSHDSGGSGGDDPPSGGDPPSGDDTISGGGGDDPPSGDDPPPDDGGTSTPSNPVDPFKPTGDPEGEDQQYAYEYTFKLEENHPALGWNVFLGPTATTPRTYRFGLNADGEAVLFLPAEFAISGNSCAISQKLLLPETVTDVTKTPIELGARLVAHGADNNLIKFTISASDLDNIKTTWGVNSIVGSLLVLVYDYTSDSNDKIVNHVRFIPQETADNITSWSLFRTLTDGTVTNLRTSIKVPISVHSNNTVKYWLSDYMPVTADSEVDDTTTSCMYLQGFRLQRSNGNSQLIPEAYRAAAPLAYFAAALWQTTSEDVPDDDNPSEPNPPIIPPQPEPSDYSANATDYDSSFPNLIDLCKDRMCTLITNYVKDGYQPYNTRNWFLDFVLEEENSDLYYGKKSFTREYKPRNHYVSGHFAMHGDNAVLYLPENYFDGNYLKDIYLAPAPRKKLTVCLTGNFTEEAGRTTKQFDTDQLVQLNGNTYTLLKAEYAYNDMPLDTGYRVIAIPKDTLNCVRCGNNTDLKDIHLVLEYQFDASAIPEIDTTYYGYLRFLPMHFLDNAPDSESLSDITLYTISQSSSDYLDCATIAEKSFKHYAPTIALTDLEPTNTKARFTQLLYKYEYNFMPAIALNGGNIRDLFINSNSLLSYWLNNNRAGDPTSVSNKLPLYIDFEHKTDNMIIMVYLVTPLKE